MKVAIDEDDDNGGGNWWGFKWKQEGSLRLQEAGDLVAKAAKVSSSEELEGASWSGVGGRGAKVLGGMWGGCDMDMWGG